jgi:hypothetical protein
MGHRWPLWHLWPCRALACSVGSGCPVNCYVSSLGFKARIELR